MDRHSFTGEDSRQQIERDTGKSTGKVLFLLTTGSGRRAALSFFPNTEIVL